MNLEHEEEGGHIDGGREAAEFLASALEAQAQLQERGDISGFENVYEPTHAAVWGVTGHYADAITFGLIFLDSWIDAAAHDWKYYEPIRREDWPRHARSVAAALRAGELVRDPFLLERFRPRPRRSLYQWLRDLLT